jgi:hypothetical protein
MSSSSSSSSSTPAGAAAAAGSNRPLADLFRTVMQQQQQQQGGASTGVQDEQQQQQLLKCRYSLLVSTLKGLLRSGGGTALGDARLMCASVKVTAIVVGLCSAAGAASSSGSSRVGALSVQQLAPWMALAARCVITAVEMHMSLKGKVAAGAPELAGSNVHALMVEVAAEMPDGLLQQLLPAVSWLVDCLEQHQLTLRVPAELLKEQQRMNSRLHRGMAAVMRGPHVRMAEAAQPGAAGTPGVEEMLHNVHSIAMCILAQVPQAYACNNPGVWASE